MTVKELEKVKRAISEAENTKIKAEVTIERIQAEWKNNHELDSFEAVEEELEALSARKEQLEEKLDNLYADLKKVVPSEYLGY